MNNTYMEGEGYQRKRGVNTDQIVNSDSLCKEK